MSKKLPILIRNCDVCGETYQADSWKIRTTERGGRTCSKACSYILRKNHRTRDLTGLKFNHLTVLELHGNVYSGKTKTRAWKCKCDCGNTTIVRICDITRKKGATISCGCQNFRKKRESANWKGIGEVSSVYFSRIKGQAKLRNLEFTITHEEISKILESQSHTCALTGWPIKGRDASVDRIDSTKGYISGNVQWVHKHMNRFKSNFSESKLLEYCKAIISWHTKTKCR